MDPWVIHPHMACCMMLCVVRWSACSKSTGRGVTGRKGIHRPTDQGEPGDTVSHTDCLCAAWCRVLRVVQVAGIVAAHYPDDPAANGMAPGGVDIQ